MTRLHGLVTLLILVIVGAFFWYTKEPDVLVQEVSVDENVKIPEGYGLYRNHYMHMRFFYPYAPKIWNIETCGCKKYEMRLFTPYLSAEIERHIIGGANRTTTLKYIQDNGYKRFLEASYTDWWNKRPDVFGGVWTVEQLGSRDVYELKQEPQLWDSLTYIVRGERDDYFQVDVFYLDKNDPNFKARKKTLEDILLTLTTDNTPKPKGRYAADGIMPYTFKIPEGLEVQSETLRPRFPGADWGFASIFLSEYDYDPETNFGVTFSFNPSVASYDSARDDVIKTRNGFVYRIKNADFSNELGDEYIYTFFDTLDNHFRISVKAPQSRADEIGLGILNSMALNRSPRTETK